MIEKKPVFTAHNIKLDNGEFTIDSKKKPFSEDKNLIATKRFLNSILEFDKGIKRIADLGCLEGGYTTEFARMGFDSLGLEVRDSNMSACRYVKSNVDLPGLHFSQDSVLNLENYGRFDAVFCAGLLYHLENPREYLKLLGKVTRKAIIVETHFSVGDEYAPLGFSQTPFKLSEEVLHEGLRGRWYSEFPEGTSELDKDSMRWSSWENHKSFWLRKDELVRSIHEAGFTTVFEQYDNFSEDFATNMGSNYYARLRGTFIGIKQ